MKWGRVRLTVVALGAVKVADKLARAGIGVRSFRAETKNRVSFDVARKDAEKVFAILRGSCYNVEEVRPRGLALLWERALGRAGLIAGLVLFCAAVLFAQTRVLRVEVVGSGAYYEAEVLGVLEEAGIKAFSPRPRDSASVAAKLLSLPRVSYCSLRHAAGVLTVELEVSDEGAVKRSEPLLAPAAGIVEELVVLRGTPLVSIGDTVGREERVVDNLVQYGDLTAEVIVSAKVVIVFEVSALYAGSEEQARSAAILEYGSIEGLKTEQTAEGVLVTGRARAAASLNL